MLRTEKVSATSYPPVVLGRPEERWRRDRRRRRHLRRDEQHCQHRPCRRHLLESIPTDRRGKKRERPKDLRKTAGGNRFELSSTETLEKSYLCSQQDLRLGICAAALDRVPLLGGSPLPRSESVWLLLEVTGPRGQLPRLLQGG